MTTPERTTRRAEAQPGGPGPRTQAGGTGLTPGDWRMIAAGAVLTAVAGALRYLPVPPVAAFVASGVALALLAALVGRAVDALGNRLGVAATGAVQSALGNLPELFFGIFALRAGLVGVVQAALVGSVLANVLVVLGLAFVVGGARHGTQRFDAEPAKALSLLLLLAVAVAVVPSLASLLDQPVAHHLGRLSDVAAVILLAVYGLSLLGSLRARPPGARPTGGRQPGARPPAAGGPVAGEPAADGPGGPRPARQGRWPLWVALGLLGTTGAAAAAVSDWFVHALQPAIVILHISPAFAGLVIVAIAGNAVENVVGIQLAARNQPDLALSIILQSPLQIALVLVPALVLLSHVLGGAVLTLVFPPLLIGALALAAVVVTFVVIDGESTWLEGVALLGLYAVVATSFWWG